MERKDVEELIEKLDTTAIHVGAKEWKEAANALRELLEENDHLKQAPEGVEPVAWIGHDDFGYTIVSRTLTDDCVTPLYSAAQLTAVTAKSDALKKLLESCRSSVKFDLLHYEKMSSAYKNLGAESEEKHELAEAEANHLHRLMDDIDAAMQKGGM